MELKVESTVRLIDAPQQRVYDTLSDLSNISRVRDRIPADKARDLTFDTDSVSVTTPVGSVKLHIVEREAPKCIKFETVESPMPFFLWVQLLPSGTAQSRMKLTVKAEVSLIMRGMVKKPLEDGIEKIADALQAIKY